MYENETEIRFPDRCGKFFKLSIKDREEVLKATGFCPSCMVHTKTHKQAEFEYFVAHVPSKYKIILGLPNCPRYH